MGAFPTANIAVILRCRRTATASKDGPLAPVFASFNARQRRRAPEDGAFYFQIISFAAIKPPLAINTAAIAIATLGFAKPAIIRNAVESSGVA